MPAPCQAVVHPDAARHCASAATPAGHGGAVSRCDTCSTEAARECWPGRSTASPASPSGPSSLLHVLDIYLVGANPGLYDDLLQFYASPVGRVGETLLGAALLYHALNGLRIIVMDFWPAMTVYHKQLWYANWVIFVVVGLPGALHHPSADLGLGGVVMALVHPRRPRRARRAAGSSWPSGTSCACPGWPCSCWRSPTSASSTSSSTRPRRRPSGSSTTAGASLLWRTVDWLLLTMVVLHAFLGVRTVVQDYVHGRRRARP